MGFRAFLSTILIHPTAKEIRKDSWQNFTTGTGTSRDKTTHGRFFPTQILQHNELLALYNGSALARKVIEKRPTEMLRMGYELEADGVDADDLNMLQKVGGDYLTDERFYEAMIWSALFGGGLLLMGVDDGEAPDQPLNESAVESVKYLNFVDRRFIWVQSYYNDPLSPKYGMPETYLVTNTVSQGGTSPALQGKNAAAVTTIHESRCIRFDGLTTDVLTRQQLAGWTFSLLQPIYDSFRKLDLGFDSAGHLLSDASQAVFGIKGLIDAIAAGQGNEIQARMQLLDQTRSTVRCVVLDAGDESGPPETFKREPTTFNGIADVLQMLMCRFAADVDMPQTELFGEPPKGLNASSDGDTRKWYDTIKSKQTKELGPKLARWYYVLSLDPKNKIVVKPKAKPVVAKPLPKPPVAVAPKPVKTDADKPLALRLTVNFKPLWAPTIVEQAQADLAVAEMDQIYVTIEMITPEELAQDRTELYPSMDIPSRQAAAEAQRSFDPHANDPPDPAPLLAQQQLSLGQSNNPNVPLPVPTK